jgi:4-aminobutyrate aminotransferase-like enzyme
MSMANAFELGRVDLTESERALIDRRNRLLGPAYRLFYDRPLHFVCGEGVWLYGADGTRFLDVYNNVAVVGHCHPRVVAALTQQAAILNTHTRYLHEGILDYAEALLATLPAELGHMLFTCTGSESNDLAYRLAKEHTGGTGFIVTELAYHGGTNAIAELSPSLGKHVALGTHVRTVRAPDNYRRGDRDISETFAKDVYDAIADLRRHGIRPAALLVDSIFASDGVFSDPPGFLREAVKEIRDAGGVYIADEVQAGFARTGDRMWGFERHGVVPDIVTMGKPMGAGYPMAGVAVRPAVVQEFSHSRYFNTFGGNPVAAAVGLAVLNVIRSEGLQDNASVVGAYLRDRLSELGNRHEVIGDVRGAGLFIGLELVSDRTTKAAAPELTARVVNELRMRRVLISSCGPFANVLKIRPPLVFSKENADQFLAAFEEVLEAIQLPRGS